VGERGVEGKTETYTDGRIERKSPRTFRTHETDNCEREGRGSQKIEGEERGKNILKERERETKRARKT